jgi:hypothetical protein
MTLAVVLYINPKTQSLCYHTMFPCKKVFVLLHHVPMQDKSICVLTAYSYARHSLCVFTSCSYAKNSLCVFTACFYARQVSVFLNHIPMQDTIFVLLHHIRIQDSLCVVMSHYYATIYLTSYKVHDA